MGTMKARVRPVALHAMYDTVHRALMVHRDKLCVSNRLVKLFSKPNIFEKQHGNATHSKYIGQHRRPRRKVRVGAGRIPSSDFSQP